jgi:hypothetical protein
MRERPRNETKNNACKRRLKIINNPDETQVKFLKAASLEPMKAEDEN